MASKGGVIVVVSGEDKTGQVFDAIKRHMAETEAKAKETSSSLGSIGGALEKGLAAAGIVIGLREIIGGMKEVITSTMEAGVQFAHLNQQTGISVENLSVLKYAAQSTGVDFETLTRGFKKLAVTTYDADNGSKKAAKGFEQVGISMADLRAKGDDMYAVMTLVADKFHAMPDGINKSDAAAKIFGARMGSEMIPVLDTLGGKLDTVKAEAQALGIVWDDAGIKKMEEMHHNAVMLQGSLQGLGLQMTTDLAPALNDIAVGLAACIHKLKEWQDLNAKPATIAHEAAEMGKTIPGDIAGDDDPGRIARREGAIKFGTQKQLADLEEAHNKHLVSEEKYRAEKSALQARWNNADLRQNQAYFTDISDQITKAESVLATTTGGSASWQRNEQAFLASLIDKQKAAMDSINAASKNIAKSAAPAAAVGSGGSGGLGTGGKVIDLRPDQERVANAHRQLINALAKSDEVRARTQAQTLLEINAEMHRQGLRSETEYLAQKQQLEERQFDAEHNLLGREQRAVLDQISTLKAEQPKTEKDRLDIQARLNQLEAQYLGICDKVTELDERRAKAAREIEAAMANAHLSLPEQKPDLSIFQSRAPNVVLGKQPWLDAKQIEGEAEKFAHGIFDPLFNLGEKWSDQWKQIRANMLRDLGQAAESQLFGALFGDPEGRGGKGWNGGSFEGDSTRPGRKGLSGSPDGLIGNLLGMFHKKAGPVSNGTGAAGAGTVLNAAASAMQIGKSGGGNGIQVVLNNQGTALQVDSTQQSGGDGGEGQVIQIMLKQLETNGPVSQGIMGLFNR